VVQLSGLSVSQLSFSFNGFSSIGEAGMPRQQAGGLVVCGSVGTRKTPA